MNGFFQKITDSYDSISRKIELNQMPGGKELLRDRYKILQVLGRGGFGITYLAKNTLLPGNPLCVIKQLSPKATSRQSWQKACMRFQKEAQTLALLGSHSQVPMLLDYFQIDREFYLVQEYVKGTTLAREVKRTGLKSEAAVKQFLQELLPVLQYLHQHRVIHRDIKPQNLLRREDDGRVVLIDFGAVKEQLIDTNENSINVSPNTNFVGTMGFAPPEQFSLRPVYASDIYALGVTCIYLLTGKSPLEFDQDPITGDLCWQKDVNISDRFAEVLGKMVKFSLHDRFQTADEVIKALNQDNYFSDLENCLTNQRLNKKGILHHGFTDSEITYHQVKHPQITQQDNSDVYAPPISRTADAIRRWKARQK
ncbi:MAG: serine/threonine-protein kinase [Nostoc sp. ChiSLP02]|nr:serine/threonine-protein kinase [Nostoc sp. DedSLP05]MDZ8098745.1 serine/threonine-protein kinase [Nostoc sp. DedSLP01]MDZ8183642.1 serine/threonine-protein kinase [Nostoc sp. ChiSLP02]